MQFTLGTLKKQGFHVRGKEKYIIENKVPRRRVVDHFISFAIIRVLEPLCHSSDAYSLRPSAFIYLVEYFCCQQSLSHSEQPRSNTNSFLLHIKN